MVLSKIKDSFFKNCLRKQVIKRAQCLLLSFLFVSKLPVTLCLCFNVPAFIFRLPRRLAV